jgi:TonB family protein
LAAEDKRDEADAQFQRAMAMSEHTKWPSAARDYRDFLRRIGRDADVAALERSLPFLGPPQSEPGVTAPQVIGKREPQYSEAARTRRLVGTVVLVLEIDPSGVPVNIQVLEPLGFGLDEKAIAAAGNWRFRPGAKDGKPVTVAATIEVTFRLL